MRFLAILSAVILIAGCATGYKSVGFTGGYSDTKLQDDVYEVSFKGNGYTNKDRAKDFALLRASEVALNNGYKYFVVLEGENSTKTQMYTTPAQANTYGTVNMYGNTGSYSGTTYYSGGQTFIAHKPQTSLTIRCLKEKPTTNETFVYDATQIKENLSSKYGIK